MIIMARLGVVLTCIYKSIPDARFMLISRGWWHYPCLNFKSEKFVRTLVLKNNLLLASYTCEEFISICLYNRSYQLVLQQYKNFTDITIHYYYDKSMTIAVPINLKRIYVRSDEALFLDDIQNWRNRIPDNIGIYEIYECHLESLIAAITSENTMKIVNKKIDHFRPIWDKLKKSEPEFSWQYVIENIKQEDEEDRDE